jgi:flagellin FlaB
MKDSETAFTGLEAAIVLIAFIIVASVFAYVTLGAGFFTTQKSQEVVHTGVATASSTLQVVGDVYGVGEAGTTINMINFSVGLAAGGSTIDFDKVSITYSNETNLETLTPVSGRQGISVPQGYWAITSVNGEVGPSNNLLEKGEQFALCVHPVSGTPKDTVLTVEVKPGTGSTVAIKRTAPAAIRVVNVLY